MSLLQMSFSGAVLILAIVIIRWAAIHRLPKNTFLILWDIALLRLLIPFSVPSILSVYSLMERKAPAGAMRRVPVRNVLPVVSEHGVKATQTVLETTQALPYRVSLWTVLWLAGMILCILFFTVSYLHCLREFRISVPVHNEFVRQWLKDHPTLRAMTIRQSDRITAPVTYGIFRPVILMPKKTDWADRRFLEYVLLHEYIHIRRFDAVWKLLTALALCIHWFNPMVWVMYVLFSRDMELTCDECVVRRFGVRSRSSYARMLISMEEKKSSQMPLCNNFGKNAIEERVTAIMKMKKKSFLTILMGIVLIVVLTTACATSAPAAEISEKAEAADEDVIRPLYPLERAEDALADGGYSVCFDASSLEKTDSGYALNVEVFEYDRYDPSDIAKLEEGSRLQVCNEVVEVSSLDKSESGYIMINGGVENGGVELTEDDGLYRTITMDDYPVYYSVGKVTIPLSEEMTLEDHLNLEQEPDGEVSDLAGFVEVLNRGDTTFSCANTIITVRQEQILQVIRYWTP